MKRIVLALPFLAVPMLAQAQPVSGLYVGAGAGADFMANEFLKLRTVGSIGPSQKARVKFDTGVMGEASVGYGFGNGFRLELEGLYATNSVRNTVPARQQDKYGGMVNGLFDFDIGSPYVFPYAGIGGGYVSTSHNLAVAGLNGPVNYGYRKGTAAYQGIVGAAFPIPFVVGLSATLDYRFVGLADSKRTVNLGPAFNGARVQEKVLNNLSNIVTVGLRYQFDVAPPPPPPMAAAPAAVQAAPSRTYLVFFDWDRADLTARARQIIADAAANATKVQYTRIEVDGNADRSGTPAYNIGLSRRRAETVAAELVRDGIPRAAIDIQAFGDTRPLVPTAAGVREPQNRRVEIVIR